MTDDDLTPQQQEVRRLLAGARHEEPMPDPVVARLDRVLIALAAEPVPVSPVTDLATRRRRAGSLLLAAAAVVAIGVGVGQVVGTGSSGENDMAVSTRDEAGGQAADTDGSPDGAPGAAAPEASTRSEERGPGTFVEIGRGTLADDVSALRELRYSTGTLDGLAAPAEAAGVTCRSETWGEGQFVPVRYDGIPAVLVFRRAVGESQVVDLFLCGDSEPRRSVTLPAP